MALEEHCQAFKYLREINKHLQNLNLFPFLLYERETTAHYSQHIRLYIVLSSKQMFL